MIWQQFWGADSLYPVDSKLDNGYDLYSWVMRKHGFPAFWGRPITGKNKISKEEMEFLRERQCKTAIYFTELTEAVVSASNGTEYALQAVSGAEELGVAAGEGIAIFAVFDREWSINHNWMISFAAAINAGGFVPAFIGNTDSSVNFNFNRQCGHFVRASEEDEYFGAIFGATEPKTGREAAVWTPYYPSDLSAERIALWQNGTVICGSISANTTYAHDESILSYMW